MLQQTEQNAMTIARLMKSSAGGQRILHDVVGLLNLSVNHGFFLVFSGITLFFNNSVDTGTGKMHCRPEIFFVAKQK